MFTEKEMLLLKDDDTKPQFVPNLLATIKLEHHLAK